MDIYEVRFSAFGAEGKPLSTETKMVAVDGDAVDAIEAVKGAVVGSVSESWVDIKIESIDILGVSIEASIDIDATKARASDGLRQA